MSEVFNIYCDESCHLERDRRPVMVLGCVWCPTARAAEISTRLREIKQEHRVLSEKDLREPRERQFEVKWTKVSASKLRLYRLGWTCGLNRGEANSGTISGGAKRTSSSWASVAGIIS